MAQQQIHGDASTMDSVYSIKQFVAYISLSFGSFEAAEPPIKTHINC